MSTKNQIISNLPEITNVDANSNIIGISVDSANVGNLTVSGNLNVQSNNFNLGDVSNVHILGGTNGQLLQTDGTGNLSWTSGGGGGGVVRIIAGDNITISPEDGIGAVTINATGGNAGNGNPGGSSTQLQYNAAGNFGGIPTATYNGTKLSVGDTTDFSIGGGESQFVLSTDGNGNLSWVPQSASGGSILFQSVLWQTGLGPAGDAYYWNGTASVPNPKPLLISYIIPATANQITLMTIDGTPISNAGITVTDTGFTVPAVNIPSSVQSATDALVLILKVSDGGTNIELGQTSLAPVLANVDPFSVTGTLTATATNPTAVPYWQPQLSGTVTASGLGLGGGGLANVTYTLLAGGANVTTSPARTNFNNYTFTNVPVGLDYSLSASVNGLGLHGARPTVNTAVSSVGTVSVNPQTYTPVFYKTTSSPDVPQFQTSDDYIAQPFAIGQNVPAPATLPGDYFWVTTPTNTPRTFKFFSGSLEATVTPDVNGTNTISGQVYNVYGFTSIDSPIVLIIS